MAYESPANINASQGMGQLLEYVNTVTNSWISNMLLVSLYIIMLMGWYRTQGNDFVGGLAVAGFGTSVIATLLWIAGFVSGPTLGVCFAVMLIGVAALLLMKD